MNNAPSSAALVDLVEVLDHEPHVFVGDFLWKILRDTDIVGIGVDRHFLRLQRHRAVWHRQDRVRNATLIAGLLQDRLVERDISELAAGSLQVEDALRRANFVGGGVVPEVREADVDRAVDQAIGDVCERQILQLQLVEHAGRLQRFLHHHGRCAGLRPKRHAAPGEINRSPHRRIARHQGPDRPGRIHQAANLQISDAILEWRLLLAREPRADRVNIEDQRVPPVRGIDRGA